MLYRNLLVDLACKASKYVVKSVGILKPKAIVYAVMMDRVVVTPVPPFQIILSQFHHWFYNYGIRWILLIAGSWLYFLTLEYQRDVRNRVGSVLNFLWVNSDKLFWLLMILAIGIFVMALRGKVLSLLNKIFGYLKVSTSTILYGERNWLKSLPDSDNHLALWNVYGTIWFLVVSTELLSCAECELQFISDSLYITTQLFFSVVKISLVTLILIHALPRNSGVITFGFRLAGLDVSCTGLTLTLSRLIKLLFAENLVINPITVVVSAEGAAQMKQALRSTTVVRARASNMCQKRMFGNVVQHGGVIGSRQLQLVTNVSNKTFGLFNGIQRSLVTPYGYKIGLPVCQENYFVGDFQHLQEIGLYVHPKDVKLTELQKDSLKIFSEKLKVGIKYRDYGALATSILSHGSVAMQTLNLNRGVFDSVSSILLDDVKRDLSSVMRLARNTENLRVPYLFSSACANKPKAWGDLLSTSQGVYVLVRVARSAYDGGSLIPINVGQGILDKSTALGGGDYGDFIITPSGRKYVPGQSPLLGVSVKLGLQPSLSPLRGAATTAHNAGLALIPTHFPHLHEKFVNDMVCQNFSIASTKPVAFVQKDDSLDVPKEEVEFLNHLIEREATETFGNSPYQMSVELFTRRNVVNKKPIVWSELATTKPAGILTYNPQIFYKGENFLIPFKPEYSVSQKLLTTKLLHVFIRHNWTFVYVLVGVNKKPTGVRMGTLMKRPVHSKLLDVPGRLFMVCLKS